MTSAADLVLSPLGVEAFAVRRGAPELRVVRAGMGPERARRAARRWRAAPARSLVVAGLCGALVDDLAPGDLVVPDVLIHPDGTRRTIDGERLRAHLADRGIFAHAGALLGVDHVVRGVERAALRASGAVAVDMESPWLADAAAGRPFAVLRVVLDAPGAELRLPGLVPRAWRALARLRAVSAVLPRWATFEPEPERS